MIGILKIIEEDDILDLLQRNEIWNTLEIDYIPPRVERVWTQYNDEYRILIHKIYPCDIWNDDDVLYHPHPWKSAIHVLPIGNGVYKHVIGSKDGNYCSMEVHGEMYYEMLDPNAYHSVQPIYEPVYSVMLIGKPIWKELNNDFFEGNDVKSKDLKPLDDEIKDGILQEFINYYE